MDNSKTYGPKDDGKRPVDHKGQRFEFSPHRDELAALELGIEQDALPIGA
jgi:hypothetical protein